LKNAGIRKVSNYDAGHSLYMIYFIILHHKSKQKEYEKDDTVLVRSFLFIFNCICSEQSAKGRTFLFSQKTEQPKSVGSV